MTQPIDMIPEEIEPLKIAQELERLKPYVDYSKPRISRPGSDDDDAREAAMGLGAITIRQLHEENANLRELLAEAQRLLSVSEFDDPVDVEAYNRIMEAKNAN